MPRAAAFNPKEFARKVLALLQLIGPLLLAAKESGNFSAEGPMGEAEIVATLAGEGSPLAEPGKFGGPITDAVVTKALRSLLALAEANVDEAVTLVGRILDRISPITLP